MEKKTIGRFIATLRKANGMTQKELGERLFVSDKTVSRWECDETTPELSLLPIIAELFGITVDELLRGERNGPSTTYDTEQTQHKKAKSDKQYKRMLVAQRKKAAKLSFVTVGITLAGIIADIICNLCFSEGLLGFCIASVFFAAALICQLCFSVSCRLELDDEAEASTEITKVNNDIAYGSVKTIFGIIAALAFCLPTALMIPDTGSGIAFDSWLLYGVLFAIIALAFAFIVYKLFVLKLLINKSIICISQDETNKIAQERRLLIKISIVFTAIFVATTIGLLVASANNKSFIEIKRFTDADEFIEYVQKQYDEWYEEGYGAIPDEGFTIENTQNADFPIFWGEIDGKTYYFNKNLYRNLDIFKYEAGIYDIRIVTYQDYANGTALKEILNELIIALYFINAIVCGAWYFIGLGKLKNAKF